MSDLRLKLLAFVPGLDEQTKAYCRGVITAANPQGAREGKYPYFAAGYVNIEIPRDSAYTTDIRTASKHWALADDKGNLIQGEDGEVLTFDSFADVETARAGARIAPRVEISVPKVAAAK